MMIIAETMEATLVAKERKLRHWNSGHVDMRRGTDAYRTGPRRPSC